MWRTKVTTKKGHTIYYYLCRHPCIHLDIYYSSIYRPVLSSLPTWLFQYTKYLIISHPTKWHTTPPFYILRSSISLMWKQKIVDISIEQNTWYEVISYLHYSHRRSNNIQNIDELRPSLLLRCQQNILSLTSISTATEDVVASII